MTRGIWLLPTETNCVVIAIPFNFLVALNRRVTGRLETVKGTAGAIRDIHAPSRSLIGGQKKYRRSVGSGFRLRRCVQHLTRTLTPRNQAINTFFRRRKRNVCRAPKEQINQLLRIPPPEMRDELVAHSVATGRTLTETVREALRSYLAARGEIISERERR